MEIKNFINKFRLNLVHVHANNFSPIRLDDNLPLVLELTFSKYAKFSSNYSLPHKFDMLNNRNVMDYELIVNE